MEVCGDPVPLGDGVRESQLFAVQYEWRGTAVGGWRGDNTKESHWREELRAPYLRRHWGETRGFLAVPHPKCFFGI